jgi:translation initiation factor RLI1
MSEKHIRIAIVSSDKCKPKKCRQECKKSCPVVRMGEYFDARSKSVREFVHEIVIHSIFIFLQANFALR